jgi:hypothetical protein
MRKNLVRVSKADSLPAEERPPVKNTTLYKWHHLKKFPQLFIKVSGILFVDLDALDELIESKRGKA